MNKTYTCQICGSHSVTVFLQRKDTPVHQNLLLETFEKAIQIEKGDICLTVCEDCGFVYNQAFDWNKLVYGEDYDSTQTISPSFQSYETRLIDYLIHEKNIKNSKILEIGCGKGSFIRRLTESKEWGNIGYGFDPSYVGPLSMFDGRLNFVKSYYDEDAVQKYPNVDVLICRHVLEHLSSPISLLKSLRKCLDGFPEVKIFFEVPCGEWILRKKVFWDIFYEHCSYFTKGSLKSAFELAGFEVKQVTQLFEWPYLWLEASIAKETVPFSKDAGDMPILAKQFSQSEYDQLNDWKQKIKRLLPQGKVAFWGAAAKGTTFANLIDPKREYIDCFIDLNPNKQGKFLSGTGHSVLTPYDAVSRGVSSALLMNPNYFEENRNLLQESGLNLQLVQSIDL
jgi:SAM-dependent methyltransferase